MKGLLLLVFGVFLVSEAFANDNSCDDFLSRHRRSDLVAKSVYFFNRNGARRYQAVKLKVKNIGEVDFNPIASDVGEYRAIYVRVNGRQFRTKFRIPLDSNQETTMILNLPANTLRHCGTALIEIDNRHTAKQWGCRVWNNDSKSMRTVLAGRICR